MNRRLKLPVVDAIDAAATTPTPEALRRALGGRLASPSSPELGRCVSLDGQSGRPVVVLFADEGEVHVWVGQGRVRQARRESVQGYEGEVPAEEAAIARDIARFAGLSEGEPVAFLHRQPGGPTERGTLVEKCRFGALVLRPDGTLVGVGFRRLWRAEPGLN